jgi:hypothetical protein
MAINPITHHTVFGYRSGGYEILAAEHHVGEESGGEEEEEEGKEGEGEGDGGVVVVVE